MGTLARRPLLRMPGLVALSLLVPALLTAQEGRYRVLIPDFQAMEGADRGFGEEVAKKLRERMDALVTHEVVERDELRSELRDLDLEMSDLGCIPARQVGTRMGVEVVLCAEYRQQPDGSLQVEATFWDLNSEQAIDVPAFAVGRKEHDAAAARIHDTFERFVQLAAHSRYCIDYVAARMWDDALRNCDAALEMSPEGVPVRYHKARALVEMERPEEAYEELTKVLEQDPVHELALQLAGYVATQLGLEEEGRRHYRDYLTLQPGAVAVRRRVAYDLFKAGDAEGAMLLIQDGLELEESPELYLDLGNYAFAAAGDAEASPEEPGPEAMALYRTAVDAYAAARASAEGGLEVSQERNLVNGLLKIGDLEGAVTAGRAAVEAHPGDAALWSTLAESLQRSGELDEALAALERVVECQPDYPRVHLRRGVWLLEAGRSSEALQAFREAVESGEDADVVARAIFAQAYAQGVKAERWEHTIELTRAAAALEPSAQTRAMLDFWQGYALYQQGMDVGEPQDRASAERALPLFQRALGLFQAGRAYAASEASIDLGKFLEATRTYIEIQEAILKRSTR